MTDIKEYKSFDDMKLKMDLLKGIYAYGFETPSPIQQKAIVPLSEGKDLIAQSQSGTGKTGTFSIGILQLIDVEDSNTQALVLAPTRELAKQSYTVIKSLGYNMKGLRVDLAIGGTKSKDYSKWEKPEDSHIIIGTPGRVLDNITRKKIHLNKLRVFALDEADEMLSRGFVDQIYNIFQNIPEDTQVALFSATMPPEVLELSKKFIEDPIKILVKRDQLTLEGISQYFVGLERKEHKIDVLIDLFQTISITQCIIFINRKVDAEYLYDILKKEDFEISLVTGNMSQDERNDVIQRFRTGTTRILLTTGLLSRGFDVQQVSLVINFDFPRDKESYLHSAGRSGRMGRKGCVINLVTEKEYEYLQDVEKYYSTKIYELPENIKDII
jgi:translation initiation factor 4A